MRFTIRKRIWGSFLILMSLFVINGIITVVTLLQSKELSRHISTVIDPAQQYLQDIGKIIVESKMYATNWVFLRSDEDDKYALRKLHDRDYPAVKQKLTELLPNLDQKLTDSMVHIFAHFEGLIKAEQGIMADLAKFDDYDDLVKKMMSEQVVENEVIPQTAHILHSLENVSTQANAIKVAQYRELESYSVYLRVFITLLSFFVVGLAIFLSIYFTSIITRPIRKIKEIINDLGKGVINKVDYVENKDEIGDMVISVNNLSEKLQETAAFAQEVGNRNFDIPFTPLSEHDTLGKALLTMRDNIKKSEENLLKTSSNLLKRNRALEQYTFIVSHNLRAPVATILGLSEILASNDMPLEDAKEMLAGLNFSAQKLDDVIHDLNLILEIKQQAHTMGENILFERLINDVKHVFNKLIQQQDIEFKCDFSKADTINCIKSYLVSILYNLVSNSIKYRRPDTKLIIEIETYKEDDRIIMLFRDTGKGIDMTKNGNKLFGLYERFDLTVEGKGMGLFMIKSQVENLGGAISVESEIDKGTLFKIELPFLERPYG